MTPNGTVFFASFRLAGGRVDLFLARSSDPEASFSPGQRITSVAFDPALGVRDERSRGPLPTWIGDYQG